MTYSKLESDHFDFKTLATVSDFLLKKAGGIDIFSEKVPALFRKAIDEVIDAPRTSRFVFSELEKTEKTYVGTKFEILLRNYLKLPKGDVLDLNVNGMEVDIKTTTGKNWMIPTECMDHPALLLRVNETTARCDIGLVVCRPEYMSGGANKDSKKQISAKAQSNIWWILRDHPYPKNFWEAFPKEKRDRIMSIRAASSRLAVLFQEVQRVPIHRNQIEAVAQQRDYMKRLRKNGGARDILSQQGIALLWGTNDRELIKTLNLGVVSADQFISVSPTNPDEENLLRRAGYIV
jgi:hypothetical protein